MQPRSALKLSRTRGAVCFNDELDRLLVSID